MTKYVEKADGSYVVYNDHGNMVYRKDITPTGIYDRQYQYDNTGKLVKMFTEFECTDGSEPSYIETRTYDQDGMKCVHEIPKMNYFEVYHEFPNGLEHYFNSLGEEW